MPIRELPVHSLGELIAQITSSEPDAVTGRGRDAGVYRGAFDAALPLLTTLDRLSGTDPLHTKMRIEAQAAVFTLCSDKNTPFDRFLEEHELGGALTKFVIPGAEVARMRDQLDLAGVDERRLFPDLDGLAAMICRYYS